VPSDELDSLFTAPPAEFIEKRKRLAAALKDAGRKHEAKAVEKIPRPSLPIWTFNQIAHRHPALVRRLDEITERLQTASGPEYAAAAVEHRQVLQELRDRAGEVLADGGHEVAPHIVQRVIANLRAAAGSAETRLTLEQGRLVRDVEEPELDSLFGVAAGGDAPAGEGEPAADQPGAPTKRGAPAGETAAETKTRERARAKAIAAADREVKRRRDAERAARKDVERAERVIAAARQSLNVAEVRAASARAAADEAAQALIQAEADQARVLKE